MNAIFRYLFIPVLLSTACLSAGENTGDTGWSATLLNRIIKAEPAKASTAAATASSEMVLRTYRLMHLRVGEAGKSQNLFTILGKLLPPGSSVNPEIQENSLHILTTETAHQAVWDYLSAVDLADGTSTPTPATVPEDVRLALTKLANAGEQSAKLSVALDALKADVSHQIEVIDERQHRQTIQFLAAGLAAAILVVGTGAWMVRRRSTHREPPRDETEYSLSPMQLTTALAPVHDKMRSDMLGLLNEVAIKLQAQHHEQQKLVREQQQQIEDARVALAEERRQFISEAGSMVVKAVERVDATTAKLAKQQDKVSELVEELQHTVRELDETKDQLRTKEVLLEQERAKIAALSILLEEGGAIPAPEIPRLNGSAAANHDSSCMKPAQTLLRVIPAPAANRPVPRFQFLPPDHPET